MTGQAKVMTFTSCEFLHNFSAAKRVVSEGGHVIITERSKPILALIPIAEYRRLMTTDQNLVELLRMPEADSVEIDFEPLRINARDTDA